MTGQVTRIRFAMKVPPPVPRTYVTNTDKYPLIPLQELIDLKMLQCKRVVNGECSSGPRIVQVPGQAHAALLLRLPGVTVSFLCAPCLAV